MSILRILKNMNKCENPERLTYETKYEVCSPFQENEGLIKKKT